MDSYAEEPPGYLARLGSLVLQRWSDREEYWYCSEMKFESRRLEWLRVVGSGALACLMRTVI